MKNSYYKHNNITLTQHNTAHNHMSNWGDIILIYLALQTGSTWPQNVTNISALNYTANASIITQTEVDKNRSAKTDPQHIGPNIW